MNTKICPKCEVEKSLSEFCKNKYTKDGLQYWCKCCVNIYNKNLYCSNKQYRQNILNNTRRYFKTDKGKISNKKSQLKYRQGNGKDKYNEYQRYYSKTPKGRSIHRKFGHNRRLKKQNITHDWTTQQEIDKLNETHGYCKICSKYIGINNLTLDHIIPISKVPIGAVYTINDIQFICKECNSRKSAKSDINYSSILKPKRLLNKLTLRMESEILHYDRNLYSKILDLMQGQNPQFTESDILFLNNL